MKIILHLSAFLLFFHIHQSKALNLDFDEPCIKGDPVDHCDFTKGLNCTAHEGKTVCRCLNETQMEYVRYTQGSSCMAFLNGNCTWPIPVDFDGYDGVLTLPCLDLNAACQSHIVTNQCECDFFYLPEKDISISSPDNRCLPAKIGASCDTATFPCHPSVGMDCFNGTCRCSHPLKTTNVLFGDPNTKLWERCLSIPEQADSCKETSDCIPNAYCGKDKKCHCSPGYTVGLLQYTEEGEDSVACLVGHEGKCDFDLAQLCNEQAGLYCLDGKCICKDDPDLTYDDLLEECAAPEGHPCTINYGRYQGKVISCRSGLECKPTAPGRHTNVGTCVKAKSNDGGGADETCSSYKGASVF